MTNQSHDEKAFKKSEAAAQDICWQWLPLVDYWGFSTVQKIGIKLDEIKKLDEAWTKIDPKYSIYGIFVPAIAKFPCREALYQGDYWWDVLSFRDDMYVVCNKAAFFQFMPFAIVEKDRMGSPVIII